MLLVEILKKKKFQKAEIHNGFASVYVEILQLMINSLKKILKVDNRITFYRNTYALHIGKEVDVIRILDWIYKDANIFLDRKHRKYIEFKKYKNTRM